MYNTELYAVTGAFGYTGKYITRRLLSQGKRVKTLTGHPNRHNPFGNHVSIAPFNFENPDKLIKSLQGATVLINTYWVRFSYGLVTYDKAVANTKILVKAAEKAGIRRIVHISISNASEDSSLPYFKGKGLLEKVIINSNLSYAIIRPTVIFGNEDILINNIAWMLRRFPLFAIPGPGDYKIQPVFVEDMVDLIVNAAGKEENIITDAVGPETFTFNELVQLIRDKTGANTRIIHMKPGLALFLSGLIGKIVRDVVLTRDEVEGLMANLLISKDPPLGKTRLSEWLGQNAATVGANYASELNRHYRKSL
ncbi:NAD-dependent epimerase/dehydratase [Desulfofarcimen acetoxidans DSM 771]|uniref:NAD-dependent epimerase/dehydratase n=1 Tax=Desulfofarcimen acetoxidans (strain ATCC 49208 / DSM 771 / KCTC 5769 / VKM B-1644 / 5575) TaxID=485916 RepID=C8W125_DESAS|nr:NAD(P)H-binding protein [Desulfofarcimen acetoxidans]ACV63421.1 NAD-dependent epimerase/dehydratase [Desulfofarcimen acetoxidans DSM 771]